MAEHEIAIAIKDIHKDFILPQHKNTSLKQAAVNIVRKNNVTTQHVLDGISFNVHKGDFFGIVGRNGSGKSTLLKLLAGVYTPTSGSIEVHGGLTPFIELGVGFNTELSGRDNVYLNGALLGFSRSQMDEMYDEIVDFAELSPFMDQKLKNYSSGMQVRLAFSVAIRAKADILVLDEVLAVGDEAFQKKCNEYFNKVKRDKNQTVVLVTHSMESIRRYCNNAALITDGKVTKIGNPDEVANAYSMQFINVGPEDTQSSGARYGSGEVTYENIRHTLTKKHLTVEYEIVNNTKQAQVGIIMGYDFFVDGEPIYGNDTGHISKYKSGIKMLPGERRRFTVVFENHFGSNTFCVNMTIATEFGTNFTDRLHPAFTFDSVNVGHYNGFRILAFPEISDRII